MFLLLFPPNALCLIVMDGAWGPAHGVPRSGLRCIGVPWSLALLRMDPAECTPAARARVPRIDPYGFERTEDFDHAAYEEFFSAYLVILTKRTIKWSKFLKGSGSVRKSVTDLNRTFPDNVRFRKTADPCLQKTLYNVLLAYGLHNRGVGYCQVSTQSLKSGHVLGGCHLAPHRSIMMACHRYKLPSWLMSSGWGVPPSQEA